MFEHFNTPEELFSWKLGSALTMEHDSLNMLVELEGQAQRPELKNLFHEHAEETRQQISNLEQCFKLLGESANESPSPTTKGLSKEGNSTIRKTDVSIVDAVCLAGGLETEHYEIAVYETLIPLADARGMTDVVSLLQQNLQQEESARDKIRQAAERVAREGVVYPSPASGGESAAGGKPVTSI